MKEQLVQVLDITLMLLIWMQTFLKIHHCASFKDVHVITAKLEVPKRMLSPYQFFIDYFLIRSNFHQIISFFPGPTERIQKEQTIIISLNQIQNNFMFLQAGQASNPIQTRPIVLSRLSIKLYFSKSQGYCQIEKNQQEQILPFGRSL